jgi:hypothetical protein
MILVAQAFSLRIFKEQAISLFYGATGAEAGGDFVVGDGLSNHFKPNF